MESKMTNSISQQMGSDSTSPSQKASVSFEIIPAVTHCGNHVANQDAADDDVRILPCFLKEDDGPRKSN